MSLKGFKPVFIVYSAWRESVQDWLGAPEYSYSFVLNAMRGILEKLGVVVPIQNPYIEADQIYRRCLKKGEHCLYLSFAPPHKTHIELECPTIPIFAWEYPDIPNQMWGGNQRNNWNFVLRQTPHAITHSTYSSNAILKCMGDTFPVSIYPTPVWNGYYDLPLSSPNEIRKLNRGKGHFFIESGDRSNHHGKLSTALSTSAVVDPKDITFDSQSTEYSQLLVEDVVFCTVLNPSDSRKNWQKIVQSFCTTFRNQSDATLLIKFSHYSPKTYLPNFLDLIRRLSPFSCRLVGIGGHMEDDHYHELVKISDFVVNASSCEGQCLPLKEFLAAGRPAITPYHSSMTDYMEHGIGFEVLSSKEPCAWPHDERQIISTSHHVINMESLAQSFMSAYNCYKNNYTEYKRMSKTARKKVHDHCGKPSSEIQFQRILEKILNDVYGKPTNENNGSEL